MIILRYRTNREKEITRPAFINCLLTCWNYCVAFFFRFCVCAFVLYCGYCSCWWLTGVCNFVIVAYDAARLQSRRSRRRSQWPPSADYVVSLSSKCLRYFFVFMALYTLLEFLLLSFPYPFRSQFSCDFSFISHPTILSVSDGTFFVYPQLRRHCLVSWNASRLVSSCHSIPTAVATHWRRHFGHYIRFFACLLTCWLYSESKIEAQTSAASQRAKIGSDVSLWCNATGYPKPVVYWTRDDRNRRLPDGTYQFWVGWIGTSVSR